jgi:hypothetical protein
MMTYDELKQLATWIKQLRWKSIDKDNMEYTVNTTCYVKDALNKWADEMLKDKEVKDALNKWADEVLKDNKV